MPYQTINDLPHRVKDHLPMHAQRIFLETFNNAWEEYGQPGKLPEGSSLEEIANKVAWSAVGHRYEKDERYRFLARKDRESLICPS